MLSASEFRERVGAVGSDSPIYTLRDLFARRGGIGNGDEDEDDKSASLCRVQTTRGDQWAGGPCVKSSVQYLVQTFRFALVSSES